MMIIKITIIPALIVIDIQCSLNHRGLLHSFIDVNNSILVFEWFILCSFCSIVISDGGDDDTIKVADDVEKHT